MRTNAREKASLCKPAGSPRRMNYRGGLSASDRRGGGNRNFAVRSGDSSALHGTTERLEASDSLRFATYASAFIVRDTTM